MVSLGGSTDSIVVCLTYSTSSLMAAFRDCTVSFRIRLCDSSATVNICLGSIIADFKVTVTVFPPSLEVRLGYCSASSDVRLSGSGCYSTGSVNDSECGQGRVR